MEATHVCEAAGLLCPASYGLISDGSDSHQHGKNSQPCKKFDERDTPLGALNQKRVRRGGCQSLSEVRIPCSRNLRSTE